MCSPGCAASGDGRPSRGRDRDNVVATSAAATTASHRAPPTPSAAPHRHCGPGRCARLGQLLLDTKRIAPRPGAMRSASKRGVLWGIAARRCRRAASLRLDAQHAPMRAAQAMGKQKGRRRWARTPATRSRGSGARRRCRHPAPDPRQARRGRRTGAPRRAPLTAPAPLLFTERTHAGLGAARQPARMQTVSHRRGRSVPHAGRRWRSGTPHGMPRRPREARSGDWKFD